jgi:hypothetical protein
MLLDFRGLVHLLRRRKPAPSAPAVYHRTTHHAHAA